MDTKVVWERRNEDIVNDLLKLKDKYHINEFNCVEIFCGDGSMLTAQIANVCASFAGYDIDPNKEELFKVNIPKGEFRCGDSVKMLMTMEDGAVGTYNLILADAFISIYGDNYCENFQALEYIYKLMKKGETTICVYPVAAKPYDTEKEENRAWMERRKAFYRTESTNLDLDKTFEIYDELFEKQKLQIIERRYTCRAYRNGVDWLYAFMYVLKK